MVKRKKWSDVKEEILAKTGTKQKKRTEVVAPPEAPPKREHGREYKTSSILNTYGRP